MKNRKWYIGSLLLPALALCGCSLAVSGKGGEPESDRLIGVFITEEYLDLFDMDAYLEDHASALLDKKEHTVTDTSQYTEKLYADIEKNGSEDPGNWEVSFKETEGIRFFSPIWKTGEDASYHANVYDASICDPEVNVTVTDTGEEISLSGTYYILPGKFSGDEVIYYVNPVYQTKDGDIYTVPGNGFGTEVQSGEGANWTSTLSDQIQITEDGVQKTEQTFVKIQFGVMYKPQKVSLLQMDAQHRIIRADAYEPGMLPQKMEAEPETAYILAETQKENPAGGTVLQREIYEPGGEETIMKTFYAAQDGNLSGMDTEIIWQAPETK